MNTALQENFDSRVSKTDDHWMWIGPLTERGYPRMTVDGKQHRGARLSMELAGTPVPATHDAVMTCGEKLCVNPAHIEAVEINAHRRRLRKSRSSV